MISAAGRGVTCARSRILFVTRIFPAAARDGRYLEWSGERSRRQILQRHFGDAAHGIGGAALLRSLPHSDAHFRAGGPEGTLHSRARITHMT